MNQALNNIYDFRGLTSFNTLPQPSFANVIKPSKGIVSKLVSGSSLKSVDKLLGGAQKVLKVYNEAVPIINSTKPMINNITTTFKLARAFKKFSGTSSLEKAFDDLPDFKDENTQEEKESSEQQVSASTLKYDNKIPAPFYPS